MTDEEVRLLKRLRKDVEPLLRDGGKTLGQIIEELCVADRFYRDGITIGKLHVALQLMAKLYDHEFCRTHKSSTKLWLVEHPRPPMPIRPVTARAGQTRASRIAEAMEPEEGHYPDPPIIRG